jgi:hypothetical protein
VGGLTSSTGFEDACAFRAPDLALSVSLDETAAEALSPVFFSVSGGSSASGAEESSLSGVDALDALSTSVLLSTLFSVSPSVPCVVVGIGSSLSGRSVEENGGDVVSGGGVNDEAGEGWSVGLVDVGGSVSWLVSAACPGLEGPSEEGSGRVRAAGSAESGGKGAGLSACWSCCWWKKGRSSRAGGDQDRRAC